MSFMQTLRFTLSNLPGWRTGRKIIVFESDDWGSIRMSSKEAFGKLVDSGIPIKNNPYCKYDALESNADLENLFEVLSQFKDFKGNHPVFTGVNVVANPDFDKIKASDFQEYFYEPFTETLKMYPVHDRVYQLWKEGVEKRLFVPQFHGREHLNVQRWMRDLMSGNVHSRLAFELGLWGIYSSLIKSDYQAAFDLEFASDLKYQHAVISEGIDLFRELYGYQPEFFVPTNGPFNLALEATLKSKGIKYIMLDKFQKEPLGDGKYKMHIRYLGKKNKHGQIYLSRNGGFEPSQFPGQDNVNACLRSIDMAFKLHKPATISTHRVNYIGWLHPENREETLRQLYVLLGEIIKRWPEVEFMTSDELGDLILADKE
ncbi:hypothetical protein SDC9_27656 [bioreactor metagenome]|uniref:Glycoside hydrolase family 57 N-terminal domain-containing protein n=1 Tax=bioreactor metagenome TaxID=1076179 RepID=A0A644URP3_9ZZZZ|nr:hypothetical protein [Lentimicrobium sp.]